MESLQAAWKGREMVKWETLSIEEKYYRNISDIVTFFLFFFFTVLRYTKSHKCHFHLVWKNMSISCLIASPADSNTSVQNLE